MGVSIRFSRRARIYLPFWIAIPVYMIAGAAWLMIGLVWLIVVLPIRAIAASSSRPARTSSRSANRYVRSYSRTSSAPGRSAQPARLPRQRQWRPGSRSWRKWPRPHSWPGWVLTGAGAGVVIAVVLAGVGGPKGHDVAAIASGTILLLVIAAICVAGPAALYRLYRSRRTAAAGLAADASRLYPPPPRDGRQP